ncbi:MAG: hypothetical protein WCO12_00005 [bacterium]
MNKILIISTAANPHADALCTELAFHEAEIHRLNIDSLDQAPTVACTGNSLLVNQSHIIPTSGSWSIFIHQPLLAINKLLPHLERIDFDLLLAGWGNFLAALESVFPDALWVNHPRATSATSRLFSQLAIAARAGLNVPDTILTNDKTVATEFVSRQKSVVKVGFVNSPAMLGKRLLTHRVSAQDISDNILNSPCYFQAYIDKQYELRVHIVGDTVLACRIDSQASEQTRVDWRNYDLPNTPHHKISLPERVSIACRTIVKELNLRFGIIDLIVNPNGEYFFLECNAQGHWLWIECLTGLPITKAVTAILLDSTHQDTTSAIF